MLQAVCAPASASVTTHRATPVRNRSSQAVRRRAIFRIVVLADAKAAMAERRVNVANSAGHRLVGTLNDSGSENVVILCHGYVFHSALLGCCVSRASSGSLLRSCCPHPIATMSSGMRAARTASAFLKWLKVWLLGNCHRCDLTSVGTERVRERLSLATIGTRWDGATPSCLPA
jgi:hypothetical protein